MEASHDQPCPEEVRQALLELLQNTLLHIRNHSPRADFCHALADHAHNIPALLARYSPALLRYYWEAEMPGFVDRLELLGEGPPVDFRGSWEVIAREYRRLGP